MANTQIAYEYIRRLYDTVLQIRAQRFDRLHKLLLVTAILFTALSYGANQVFATPASPFRLVVLILGGVAALLLAVAFFIGLGQLQDAQLRVVDVRKLKDVAPDPSFSQMNESDLWATFAKQTGDVYCLLLDRLESHRRQDTIQSCSLRFGFGLGVIFLALVIYLKVNPDLSCRVQEVSNMTESTNPTPTESAPSSGPSATTAPSAAETGAPSRSLSPADISDEPRAIQASRGLKPGLEIGPAMPIIPPSDD